MSAVLSRYGFNLALSGGAVQSSLWVGVLYMYVHYLQLMTTIERGYLYQSKLEHRLKEQGCPIEREGGYSSGWPLLSKAIDALYKIVFIMLFEVVLVTKAIAEGGFFRCLFAD